MSEQRGWRKKAGRISALVQVPFAFLAPPASPPHQPVAPPATRPGIVRPAETQPPPRVPVQYRQWRETERRRVTELQRTAMADAQARQRTTTTSQQVDGGTPAQAKAKRRQRSIETSSAAVTARTERANPGRERKRSERGRS